MYLSKPWALRIALDSEVCRPTLVRLLMSLTTLTSPTSLISLGGSLRFLPQDWILKMLDFTSQTLHACHIYAYIRVVLGVNVGIYGIHGVSVSGYDMTE